MTLRRTDRVKIYLLTSNGMPLYVGQTVNLDVRWRAHCQRVDFSPDGIAVLEEVREGREASEAEEKWIRIFSWLTKDSLYNIHHTVQDWYKPLRSVEQWRAWEMRQKKEINRLALIALREQRMRYWNEAVKQIKKNKNRQQAERMLTLLSELLTIESQRQRSRRYLLK